ncbi:MAG: biotin--[acetyl-CoA-carboxylase] ligase [Myxococcota bacterium]
MKTLNHNHQGYEFLLAEKLKSTNDWLKEYLKKHGSQKIVVCALQQSGGRGRGDNSWISPKGGLYFTISYPATNLNNMDLLGPAAGLLLLSWLRDNFDLNPQIKWPNDILINNKKLAGFLLENITTATGRVIILGLGMNIKVVPEQDQSFFFPPVSLSQLVPDSNFEIPEVFLQIAKKFTRLDRVPFFSKNEIREKLIKNSATIGKVVNIILPNGKTFSGKACGLTHDFALVVDTGEESVQVNAGDCFHKYSKIDGVNYE